LRPEYDVFIAYLSADYTAAERLANALRQMGLRVWFDKWVLAPGVPWFGLVSRGIDASAAVLVLVGPQGLHDPSPPAEVSCIGRAQRDRYRIIPVLLPGATPRNLPLFMRVQSYVDLRKWSKSTLKKIAEKLRPVPRVFLCHAAEDADRVLKLHSVLSASGI